MNKRRTLINGVILAVFAAFCLVVIEFLAINIGQPNPLASSYTVHAVFKDADGIPTAADVRASGVVVGKVTAIDHDPKSPGYTVATIQISDRSAEPIYTNGFAKIRPKTLLGEKYVDLSVGSPTTADPIASGGYLTVAQTGKDVSNDEIFNAFDSATRAQQQQVLTALDKATQGRAGDIQTILPQLQTVVANLSPVARVYEKDQAQTDDIFVQLNTIMQALADEHQQLAGFLSNGNIALGAIAAKNDALVTTLQAASNVSTELNTAMTPTIVAQRQALQQLGPTLSSENTFLDAIIGPHCNGKPCGIDTIVAGTLNGQVAYPNDQLNVTSPNGEAVTGIWDSMFSQPGGTGHTSNGSNCSTGGNHCALNVVLSFHCDTIAQTVVGLLNVLPAGTQQQIEAACLAATGHTLSAPLGPSTSNGAWLAGLGT